MKKLVAFAIIFALILSSLYFITPQAVGTEVVPHRAVTVTVAAYNSVHPEYADYICDGVNDKAEIQMAIDECSTSYSGCVQLLDGVFNAHGLMIRRDSVVLKGLGRTVTRLVLDGNDNMIKVAPWGNSAVASPRSSDYVPGAQQIGSSHISGVELRDFEISGNRANYTGNGIVLEGVHLATLSNLYIHQCALDAIHSTKSQMGKKGTACVFENIEIGECGGDGIEIDGTPSESKFDYVRIRSVGGYQFFVVDSARNHITQCHFGGTNGNEAVLMMVGDCDDTLVNGGWFSGFSNSGSAIVVDALDRNVAIVSLVDNICWGKNSRDRDGIVVTADGGHVFFPLIGLNQLLGYRYGISIESPNVVGASIYGNNCNQYKEGEIYDQGTGTKIK